ncbi:MAG: UDP-N-acetylglucosamine 2-epimerase (non-hydrolyzing) [Rhodobacteraceae bacterium]|nr:UDP-N-acetylglucosamine 2-epimerase (non-hydrolyzing) [Paracoccaceae bacterium]
MANQNRKKVITVIGARPQFIKAAAVSRIFAQTEGIEELLLHTGQHYDRKMSDVFFNDLGIPAPAYNVGISGGGHGSMTGRMLIAIEEILLSEKPDFVLVYGDTNSTLAGALVASKLHIPVAHVEAGLRSFNKAMPEEINRILTDHCSDILYSPTDVATRNLLGEGVRGDRIEQVGDIMFDAALHFGRISEQLGNRISQYGLEKKKYVLATIHRQENVDNPDRLRAILVGLQKVSGEMPVILPIHPRTRDRIAAYGMEDLIAGLKIQEPLGYLEMVALERGAAVIVTDSGGVQKEAFFHNTPCVTLRDETEWIELVEAGWNVLLSPVDPTDIYQTVMSRIGTSGEDIAPYGSGDAARKIVNSLQKRFI